MKEYKSYKCELCGTVYNNKQKALECEKSHISCREIVREVHNFVVIGSDYPTEVLIQMKDGKEVLYKRAYVASKKNKLIEQEGEG